MRVAFTCSTKTHSLMNIKHNNTTIHLLLAIASMVVVTGPIPCAFSNDVFAQSDSSTNDTINVDLQPNISAESIFNTKIMTLGNNIKKSCYPYSK